tara:strand:+ start:111 stop:479 length:369 start_codon:yes stop_codon:yes gene_type:complete
MAHFAKIGEGNIVTKVHVLDNSVLLKDGEENEQQGVEVLRALNNDSATYIQTSYNGNFRKNYASRGYTYDQARDAFIEPKYYPSWLLDEDTCQWEAPVPYPDDGNKYQWDEETTNWVEVSDD